MCGGTAGRRLRDAEELGGLDVLVNCAGTVVNRPALDLDYQTWRSVLEPDRHRR